MIRFCATIGLLLVVAGCSQLRVNVSVFDLKEFGKQEEFAEAIATTQFARIEPLLSSGRLEIARQNYLNRTRELVRSGAAASRPSENGPVPIPHEIEQELQEDFATAINNAFEQAEASYTAGVTKVWEAQSHPRGPLMREYRARANAFFEAKSDFDHGDQSLRQLRVNLNDIFAKLRTMSVAAGGQTTMRQRIAPVKNSISQSLDTLIGNNGIVEDPYASAIVSAPENFWRGTFNQTYGIGTLGNTDVAVKMDGLANFTLKGVRNDVSKITPAIFQGLQQTVHVAAAISGVPLPSPAKGNNSGTSTGGGGSTPAGTAASDLANTMSQKQAADLADLKSRAAALNLLEAIVAQRSSLPSAAPAPDTTTLQQERLTALKNIQATLEAVKPDLQMNQ